MADATNVNSAIGGDTQQRVIGLPPESVRERHITFRRTCQHYITNNNASTTPTVTYVTNTAAESYPINFNSDYYAVYQQGYYNIPFMSTSMAMTQAEWDQIQISCEKFRVVSCGFEIKQITCCQQQVAAISSTTQVTNQFSQVPRVFLVEDEDNILSSMGTVQNPTSTAPSACGNLIVGPGIANHSFATSFSAAQLPLVSFLQPCVGGTTSLDPNASFDVLTGGKGEFLASGDVKHYTWHNPDKHRWYAPQQVGNGPSLIDETVKINTFYSPTLGTSIAAAISENLGTGVYMNLKDIPTSHLIRVPPTFNAAGAVTLNIELYISYHMTIAMVEGRYLTTRYIVGNDQTCLPSQYLPYVTYRRDMLNYNPSNLPPPTARGTKRKWSEKEQREHEERRRRNVDQVMASKWYQLDGDDDKVEEKKSKESNRPIHSGFEFYCIVVHYTDLLAKHFVPHRYVRDREGKKKKSNYGKDFMYEECPWEDIDDTRIEKWATKKDLLDKLSNDDRQRCNALKTFLMKSQVLLYFHNGNDDDCSMFPKKHLHIVLRSEIGANGKPRYFHDISTYKSLKHRYKYDKKKIPVELAPYCRAEGVHSIYQILRHMNTEPRYFIGGNDKQLIDMRIEAIAMGPIVGSIKQYLEADEPQEKEEEDSEEEVKKTEKRYTGWDDNDTPLRKKAKWSDDEEDRFVLPQSSSAAIVIKENPIDKIMKLVRLLMMKSNAYNYSELFAKITCWKGTVDDRYYNLWCRLCNRQGLPRIIENAATTLKTENITKSFMQLIEEYCTTAGNIDNPKYETVKNSYKIWKQWCHKQRIDMVELITNIADVMDKRNEKINSICFIGTSNAGKTMMIANPLREVCKFVGVIGNRGNDSTFVFQDCVNVRLISIEECMIAPDKFDDYKLMLGGEQMKVQIKYQNMSTISRTPVVITANKEPWVLDYSQKDALLNRMHYYTVQTDEELKDVKPLNPAFWWYAIQQYGREEAIHFNDMVSLPAVKDVSIDFDPL